MKEGESRPVAAARPLHRAVLPRRGDRVRRGAPSLRPLPARGLPPLRRDLGAKAGADEIDAQLHAERVDPDTRAQRRRDTALDELPDGAFVLREGAPWLVLGEELLRWTAAGYTERSPRPAGEQAVLILPPSLVAVLRADWQPLVTLLHPSAENTSAPLAPDVG